MKLEETIYRTILNFELEQMLGLNPEISRTDAQHCSEDRKWCLLKFIEL